jgi:hypothetical protein
VAPVRPLWRRGRWGVKEGSVGSEEGSVGSEKKPRQNALGLATSSNCSLNFSSTVS